MLFVNSFRGLGRIASPRSKREIQRTAVLRAVATSVEQLEGRQLMSASPFSYSGAANVNEGSAFALTLSSAAPVEQNWSINWGDGSVVQEVSFTGTEQIVTHLYADGPNARTINATVEGSGGLTADTSFSADGKVTTAFGEDFSTGRATAVFPDGRIVVVGDTGSPASWAVATYNADGSSAGQVTQTFDGDAIASSVVVQGETMLVAGTVTDGSETSLVVARYSSSGGGGAIVVDQAITGEFGTARVTNLVILPGGDFLVAGSRDDEGLADNDFFIAKFHSDGSADTSFGDDGSGVVIANLGDDDQLADIAITSAGKIIAAGYATNQVKVELAQFTANGVFDTSFQGSGYVLTRPTGLSSGSISGVSSLDLQSVGTNVGKIVVGIAGFGGTSFVGRFNANGTVDTFESGSVNYISTVTLPGGLSGSDLVVNADDSFLLAGSTMSDQGSDDDFGLATYSSDGVLDTSVGTDGLLATRFGSMQDVPIQVAVDDGAVVLAGYATRLNDEGFLAADFAVARFTAGSADVTLPPLNVTVDNVLPTVAVSSATGVRQQGLSLSAGFTDPGVEGSWGITVNYGDGTSGTFNRTTPGTFDLSHTYASNGNYVVTVSVNDGDGVVATATGNVAVTTFLTVADPTNASRTLLLVGGTSGNNNITVRGSLFGRIDVEIDNANSNRAAPTGGVVVYGGKGNDTVTVEGLTLYPAIVYGGDGNDTLTGGGVGSVLVGGEDNDTIRGGGLRDILIGSAGGDKLTGNSGDDILIGGVTKWDANNEALLRIWQEWSNYGANYATRIARLRDGATGGNNAGFRLTATGSARTVFDDTNLDNLSNDVLTGNAGEDWYLANLSGTGVIDRVVGRTGNEVTTDVSLQ